MQCRSLYRYSFLIWYIRWNLYINFIIIMTATLDIHCDSIIL